MIKKSIKRALGLKDSVAAKRTLKALADGEYLTENIPYQCQFASPELVADVLEKRLGGTDDPNWSNHGFKTAKESAYWAWRGCGVACMKMVLDKQGTKKTFAEITHEGVELGGYDVEKDAGWYYKPMIQLLAKYSVKARAHSHISKYGVAQAVSRGEMFIASVNPQIIRGDTNPRSLRKSGHLVLVIGVKITSGKPMGFYIHNPSGKTPDMQKQAFIPVEQFDRSFGEQGISVSLGN